MGPSTASMIALSDNPRDESAFTVIVPAHNEERLIARTLNAMLDRWPAGRKPQVIVACNGCTDDTAHIARRAAPEAEVIELPQASKASAINAGLERTVAYPVIVVDADVEIDPSSLIALARALREPGVMAASPVSRVRTEQSDWWTRAYYRVWADQPYLRTGVGGTGVYGLSREGAARIGRFPPVKGDDTYVRWFFPPEAQRRVERDGTHEVRSIVDAPLRLKNLLACEARWQAGNIELRKLMPAPAGAAEVRRAALDWRSLPARSVYYAVKVIGRLQYLLNRLRGTSGQWHRDVSRRQPGRTAL